MHTKLNDEYNYICYSPSSTTYLNGHMNAELIETAKKLTQTLYLCDKPKKPTKRHPDSSAFLQQLKHFASQSKFSAEFPSLVAVDFTCAEHQYTDTAN